MGRGGERREATEVMAGVKRKNSIDPKSLFFFLFLISVHGPWAQHFVCVRA